MPLSQAAVLNNLLDLMRERETTYSCAVARLALSITGDEVKVCFGRIDMIGRQDPASANLDLNYGDLRLLRTTMTIDEVRGLVHEIGEGKLRTRDVDTSATGNLHEMGIRYVASRRRYSAIRPDWPSSLYGFRLDQSCTGYPTQSALVKLGLPFYPSGAEAIGEFCDLQIDSGNPPNEILFVLPDFRARFRTMRILQKTIRLDVEAKEETLENLRVKFYVESDGKRLRSPDLPIENGSVQFNYQGDLKLVMAFLLSLTKGDDIDHREFSPLWYGTRDDVTIEASELRVRELIQMGEGPRVEFKEELPDDEHRFLDSVIAFSNTYGGTILIGVNDNGEITGVKKNVEDVEKTVINWVSDKCDPRPDVKLSWIQLDGKTIVILDTPEGSTKPYQDIDRGFFVRRGASNRQARRSEVEEMFRTPRV